MLKEKQRIAAVCECIRSKLFVTSRFSRNINNASTKQSTGHWPLRRAPGAFESRESHVLKEEQEGTAVCELL